MIEQDEVITILFITVSDENDIWKVEIVLLLLSELLEYKILL